jgi:hypothetical protein
VLPFGPLVAAPIVVSVTDGWQGTKTLLLRMLQWRAAHPRDEIDRLRAEAAADAQLLSVVTAEPVVTVGEFGRKKHNLAEAFLNLVELKTQSMAAETFVAFSEQHIASSNCGSRLDQ